MITQVSSEEQRIQQDLDVVGGLFCFPLKACQLSALLEHTGEKEILSTSSLPVIDISSPHT